MIRYQIRINKAKELLWEAKELIGHDDQVVKKLLNDAEFILNGGEDENIFSIKRASLKDKAHLEKQRLLDQARFIKDRKKDICYLKCKKCLVVSRIRKISDMFIIHCGCSEILILDYQIVVKGAEFVSFREFNNQVGLQSK